MNEYSYEVWTPTKVLSYNGYSGCADKVEWEFCDTHIIMDVCASRALDKAREKERKDYTEEVQIRNFRKV